MFQYGLVGNTIFYGILLFGFGSIAWELDNISNYAVKLDDKLAKEVLGYANMDKTEAHKKKDLTNAEMRNAANRIQFKSGNLQQLEEKFEIKDDFDTGKDADI